MVNSFFIGEEDEIYVFMHRLKLIVFWNTVNFIGFFW